jgi:hypothetical protein
MFRKGVADVQEGRCGFCRGGAALSGTLRMDLRNLPYRESCVLLGDVTFCFKMRRPAADLRKMGLGARNGSDLKRFLFEM